MSSYMLLGKKIDFPEASDRFCKIQFDSWDKSAIAKNEFSQWYETLGSINNVITSYKGKVQELVEKYALMPYYDSLADYKIYDISKDSYWHRCLSLKASDNAYAKVMAAYNQIEIDYQSEVAYREERKENRGRVVGGGFGVGGAIKGMTTAGAINMTTGAAHSIANTFGNMSSKGNADTRRENLYKTAKQDLCDAVGGCILSSINNFIALINERIPQYIISSFDYSKSQGFLESAKKVADEKETLWCCRFLLSILDAVGAFHTVKPCRLHKLFRGLALLTSHPYVSAGSLCG